MNAHQEMAHRVLSTPRVTRWRVEVQQKSGAWTLAAYMPATATDERPAHVLHRLRKLFPVYKSRQLRARAV